MWLRRAVGLVQGEGQVPSECPSEWVDLKTRRQRQLAHVPRFSRAASCLGRGFAHADGRVAPCSFPQEGPVPSGWEKNTGFLSPLGTVGGVASPISQLNSSFLPCTRLDVEKQNELYKVSHVCLGVLGLSAEVLIKNLCVRFNNLR